MATAPQKSGNETIRRQAALGALNCNVTIFGRQNAETVAKLLAEFVDRIKAIPPAQPELIEKAAYIRGFEQGRTQGMIDTKAEEVAQPDLQPPCNNLATDAVIRYAAIDAIEKCYTCKHVYQRVSDADTLYCRCRKGCRYEEFKPKRSGGSPRRHEG
jgi:hypothetical protein